MRPHVERLFLKAFHHLLGTNFAKGSGKEIGNTPFIGLIPLRRPPKQTA